MRDSQSIGSCPECNVGTVTCLHNHFATDARTIDSWEHHCADCGYRLTQAFRTDAPEFHPTIVTKVCPFCGRHAVG